MNEYCLNRKNIETYLQYLREQEKSAGTLEKYKRELYELLSFLSGKNESKEELILWKAQLEQKYRPAGDNGRLVAANGFFSFFGRYDLRMELLRIQKEIFAKEEKELTKGEYALVLGDSDHLCYGDSRIRIAVYHGGIFEKGESGSKLQRKAAGDFSAHGLSAKTKELCERKRNFDRRDILYENGMSVESL